MLLIIPYILGVPSNQEIACDCILERGVHLPICDRHHGPNRLAFIFVALRFPTRDINSPAAAGVNCQEEGGNEAVVEIYDVHSGGSGSAHGAIRGYGGYFPA